ncbi:serine hydrolase domain-containing protein [Paenibacillus typhae]|uniref:serine hydrolase domain-containing protein n=1 Tax=Paenibacillus typhae TaxID=1174501 RepID=UPI001C8E8AB1|nr:serine hydrolase domain-containing protein [Paenibacillus typhae]MBY0010943.1 beta-lactamase family protein [Paenibacillus typhae]
MNLKRWIALFKPQVICLTAILLLLSAGFPAYAAEGGAAANDESPSGIRLSALEAVIDSYITTARKVNTAAVSVAVVNNGGTIFNKAYGLADVEHNVAADTDTVFEWGSVTKLLVWTSVMQLVEQGKLDLQTDIREYLPEGFFRKLKYDEPITLLNLMHHNAGWQDRYTDLFYMEKDDVPDLYEALRIYEPRQVYKPGAVVAYSNYGAALAGYIVELQSGMPFYTYVKEHIFESLGMNATSLHPTLQDNSIVAAARSRIQGYTAERELIKKNITHMGIYPAGGAIGTTADAAKFMAALVPPAGSISPLFQSDETLKQMLTPSLMYEGTDVPRIAHGFFVNEHAVRTLEHGGNTWAFSSNFVFDPVSGFGMIVMVNQQNEGQYCAGLVDRVFGTYTPAAYNGELPDSSEVEGTYIRARRVIHGFGKMIEYLNLAYIEPVNTRVSKWNGDPSRQFAPYAYTKINSSGIDYFIRDDQGKIIKLSNMYGDYLPLSGFAAQSIGISLIVLGLGTVMTLLAIIYESIGWIIRRFKRMRKPGSGLNKYYMWLNVAGLVYLLNNTLMFFRAMNTTAYTGVYIHFALNIVYILLAAGYIVLLLLKLRRSNSRRMTKVLYVLSGLSAVLFSALIIGWDLYF